MGVGVPTVIMGGYGAVELHPFGQSGVGGWTASAASTSPAPTMPALFASMGLAFLPLDSVAASFALAPLPPLLSVLPLAIPLSAIVALPLEAPLFEMFAPVPPFAPLPPLAPLPDPDDAPAKAWPEALVAPDSPPFSIPPLLEPIGSLTCPGAQATASQGLIHTSAETRRMLLSFTRSDRPWKPRRARDQVLHAVPRGGLCKEV
jgi:hypothetical protein